MAKFSLDCLIHTFHFSIEINVEFIPLEFSFVVKCHRDIIRHHRQSLSTRLAKGTAGRADGEKEHVFMKMF
jgi:hypothetical protein